MFVPKLFLLLLLFFAVRANWAQNTVTYRFLVGGHAYGAHAGTNLGLHPPFLKKLEAENKDSLLGLFLTGDIVNYSSTASWAQVAAELTNLGLSSFYVMGNHDDNPVGHRIFQEKHGGLYYWFSYQTDIYIVLNSTESDRSISPTQLAFVDQIFENTDLIWNRAFIFFHEVIWNSDPKYRLVRSNSRSRYDQIKTVSNFWQAVYPRLTALSDKKFYLFSGDVGGNPDAIAAFCDRRQNVTMLSSGMGEVADENYLSVTVSPDTVTFSLVPLQEGISMHPVDWYNVPDQPGKINGLETVSSLSSTLRYLADSVWNATSYLWKLGSGMSGASDSSSVDVAFGENFQEGKITVAAVNDGFGISAETEIVVHAENADAVATIPNDVPVRIYQVGGTLKLRFPAEKTGFSRIAIVDLAGRVRTSAQFRCLPGTTEFSLPTGTFPAGVYLIKLASGTTNWVSKVVLK